VKCQRCNEREAEVHFTEILDEQEMRELHLCNACAQDEDVPSTGSVLGMLSSAVLPAGAGATADEPAGLRCDGCGLGYREFRARGRLGCPDCYETFQIPLEPLLEKIHGGTRHVGKTPDASSTGDRTRERRLVALRRELQSAVREERYEKAAELRDRLAHFDDDVPAVSSGGSPTAEATDTESPGGEDPEGGTP